MDDEPANEAELGSTEAPPPELANAPAINAETFTYPPNPVMEEFLRNYDFPSDRSAEAVSEDEADRN